MPSITFVPSAVFPSLVFTLDGEPPKDVRGGSNGLGWGIRLGGEDQVRLASGGELNSIDGSVFISVGTATPEGKSLYDSGKVAAWGMLRHYPADKSDSREFPAQYSLSLHVSQRIYDRVLRLVELGRPPAIDVQFSDADLFLKAGETKTIGLTYGWEPDGNVKEWDDKNHRALMVGWCEFRANFGSPEPTDEEDVPPEESGWPPATRRDIARVREKLAGVQASFQKFSGQALTVGWIIAVLLGVLIFR